jgi:hypothetical protein
MRALALLAGCAALLTPLDGLRAQVRPDTGGARRPGLVRPRAPRRDTLRVPADTAGAARDSVAARVQWAEPDSVAEELLRRQGYTVTRYQADT